MIINYSNIINYLCSNGLKTFADAVEGNFKVEKRIALNSTFVIDEALLLKQSYAFDKFREQSLKNEFFIYWADWKDSENWNLKKHTPRIEKNNQNYFDSLRLILVRKFIPNSVSLLEYLRDHQTSHSSEVEKIFQYLTSLLQNLHEKFYITNKIYINKNKNWMVLNKNMPTLFYYLLQPDYQPKNLIESVFQKKLKEKQYDVLFNQYSNEWKKKDFIIHGDLRLENILIEISDGKYNGKILLIDWELCQLGDPIWDIAQLNFELTLRDNRINDISTNYKLLEGLRSIYKLTDDDKNRDKFNYYTQLFSLIRFYNGLNQNENKYNSTTLKSKIELFFEKIKS